jgi:O-antigen ligase
MDRERIDQLLERVILGLAATILVYSPLAYGAVRATEFFVVIGLTVLLAGAWAARLWLVPKTPLLWPPVCWGVLAFAIYTLVRAAFTPVQFEAQKEALQVVVYGLLFLALINNLFRQESIKIITVLVICLGLGLSLFAITQYFTHSRTIWLALKPEQFAERGSGTFIYPNHLAGYLVMLLPLAVAFAMANRISHPLRIIAGYAAVVILAGVAVTFSRGGWLAAAAVMILLAFAVARLRQQRLAAVAVLLVLLGAACLFYTKAQGKVQHRVAETMHQGKDRDPRYFLWQACVQLWQDSPWWGHGPAQFDIVYPKYRQPTWQAQLRPSYALCDYLNTLVDYGAVGTMLLAVTLALGLGGGLRTWQALSRAGGEELRGTKRAFVLGASISLIGILLAAITDFQFHLPANAILAVTLLAMLASHQRFISDKYWVPAGRAMTLLITLAVLVIGGYAAMTGWHHAHHEYSTRRSAAAPNQEVQLEALQKAVQTDPTDAHAVFWLGEFYRRRSWEGNTDYRQKAEEAMGWFRQGMDLNPNDSNFLLRYGMCLDWLGKNAQAEVYYQRALELDPNSYYVLAHVGWHYFQKKQYGLAASWLHRSLRLNEYNNPLAATYYEQAMQRKKGGW